MATSFETQLTELIPSLRAFAFVRTRHRQEGEDLVQDTMVRALGSRHQFQPGTNLKAWLFTIMRNLHIDSVRQRKREAVTDMDDDDVRDLRVAGASQFDHLVLKELGVVIGRLQDGQREALMLVVANGLSYEEAAEICKCPVGTIRSRLARGRRYLEDAMMGREPPAANAANLDKGIRRDRRLSV